MSRVFSDPDAHDEEQPELGFPAESREGPERVAARAPLEQRRGAERSDRTEETARREFFRAKRGPALPAIGLLGAVATVGFFLWLGRDEGGPPAAPPAEELAPVAAAPDFEVPFPEAGASPRAATPGPGSLAAAPEPDPSIAPPTTIPSGAPASVPAAPARTPAAPPVVRNAFSVQLLAGRSEADVGASWERLRSAHPDLLAALSPTVARTERAPGDTFYRLRAGPLPDRSAADALCKALSARQQSCFVVSPGS